MTDAGLPPATRLDSRRVPSAEYKTNSVSRPAESRGCPSSRLKAASINRPLHRCCHRTTANAPQSKRILSSGTWSVVVYWAWIQATWLPVPLSLPP